MLLKCFEYMDGQDIQSLDIPTCLMYMTSSYKFPVKCMTGGFSGIYGTIAACMTVLRLVMHLVRLYVYMHVVENERVLCGS